jgi:hypothetical protein
MPKFKEHNKVKVQKMLALSFAMQDEFNLHMREKILK